MSLTVNLVISKHAADRISERWSEGLQFADEHIRVIYSSPGQWYIPTKQGYIIGMLMTNDQGFWFFVSTVISREDENHKTYRPKPPTASVVIKINKVLQSGEEGTDNPKWQEYSITNQSTGARPQPKPNGMGIVG